MICEDVVAFQREVLHDEFNDSTLLNITDATLRSELHGQLEEEINFFNPFDLTDICPGESVEFTEFDTADADVAIEGLEEPEHAAPVDSYKQSLSLERARVQRNTFNMSRHGISTS